LVEKLNFKIAQKRQYRQPLFVRLLRSPLDFLLTKNEISDTDESKKLLDSGEKDNI